MLLHHHVLRIDHISSAKRNLQNQDLFVEPSFPNGSDRLIGRASEAIRCLMFENGICVDAEQKLFLVSDGAARILFSASCETSGKYLFA